MKISNLGCYALYGCVAVMLAACGSGTPPRPSPAGPSTALRVTTAEHTHVSPAYAVLYSFKGAPDAANPEAGLIAVKTTLYGTTVYGGSVVTGCGCGTVFKISESGDEHVLYSFNAGQDDGQGPMTGLLALDGTLYGTTRIGGSTSGSGCGLGCGSVFEVSRSGTETTIYDFQGGVDGNEPESNLIALNGTLYGTTRLGGTKGDGTVFAITSGTEKVLYSFKGRRDGIGPSAGLINVNGTLYGTTEDGGSGCKYGGCGTVFKITTSGKETVLYSFKGSPDSKYPRGGLIAVNGELYGTSASGGKGPCYMSRGCGTVFAVSKSGQERVLYSFKGRSDGKYPAGALVAVNGALYGTTSEGGGSDGCTTFRGRAVIGCGTIFEISSSGKEKVLYRFQGGTDGAYPLAGLVNVNGTLYGTTDEGGANGNGTVFSLSP